MRPPTKFLHRERYDKLSGKEQGQLVYALVRGLREWNTDRGRLASLPTVSIEAFGLYATWQGARTIRDEQTVALVLYGIATGWLIAHEQQQEKK